MKLRYGFLICLLLALTFQSPAHARKKHKPTLAEREARLIMTTSPQDNEACFSPVERCDEKLTKFIDSAQKSIDVAIYDINLEQVVHHLIVQSKKIPVRVVVDKNQSRGDHSLVSLLAKAGVNVRFGHQRGIMHNKFVIVDAKRLETGSFNYTNHAGEANNENQVYLSLAPIVERYRARFEAIWKDATAVDLSRMVSSTND